MKTPSQFASLCKAVSTAVITCALMAHAHAAKLSAVVGDVTIVRGDSRLAAKVGMRLKEGDEISSATGAQAMFRFDDKARGLIRADSNLIFKELKLTGAAETRQQTIRLIKGSLRYISSKVTVRDRVIFQTSTATIGIRGTDIEILVTEQPVDNNNPGTFLKVNTGAASLTATDGTNVVANVGEVVYGGEPEVRTRSSGASPRPSARMVQVADSLFKAGSLDRLMK
jgi:OmpA-OmpF porin, OOP family